MQDVAVHKDKQRGSLLHWENELMFKIFSGSLGFITRCSQNQSLAYGLFIKHLMYFQGLNKCS